MAGIEEQADRGAGILHQPVHVFRTLDDRAHMMVHRHAHALFLHIVRAFGEALAELLPLGSGIQLGPAGGRRRGVQDDLAGRLGKDHDIGFQRREQGQVILHRRDLGLGIAAQQFGAVPARDQRQAVLLQDRPELAGLPGKLAAQFDAAEARLFCFGQALVERDEVAQPMQAVIGPADGVDAKLHGHGRCP